MYTRERGMYREGGVGSGPINIGSDLRPHILFLMLWLRGRRSGRQGVVRVGLLLLRIPGALLPLVEIPSVPLGRKEGRKEGKERVTWNPRNLCVHNYEDATLEDCCVRMKS